MRNKMKNNMEPLDITYPYVRNGLYTVKYGKNQGFYAKNFKLKIILKFFLKFCKTPKSPRFCRDKVSQNSNRSDFDVLENTIRR